MLRQFFACASMLAIAAAARSATLEEDAKAFGTRQAFQSMEISPDGKKLVAIVGGPGRQTLVKVIDVTNGVTRDIAMSEANPETIRWCNFATDTQLICKYSGVVRIDGIQLGFSRLVTLGIDGKGLKELGQKQHASEAGIRQVDGEILDWLPDQPGSVLMARTYLPQTNTTGSLIADSREGLGVDKIDLATLKATKVETPNAAVADYITDGRGNIRIMQTMQRGAMSELTGLFTFKYRRPGSRTWEPLTEYNAITETGDYPIAVEASSNSAFVLRENNGRDALYRMKLDGTKTTTLVAENPKVDIDSVERLGFGQQVIGYSYADDQRRTVYFDPEFRALAASLGKALPQQPLITFLGANKDGSKLLIHGGGDRAPGSFYYYDKASKHLDLVALARPELQNRPLAEVKSILVPAPDGTQIPAYLTLPPSGVAKNLPAVVLPHGGPSARDEWGFDWLPQFLAARGYAVIQPNYRGSAGYGDEWMAKNGFQSWRMSIGDVTASARYLVSQGIADPGKLVIVGWSYGGYAALQSAAVEPNLYKAAVAVAPVTDLALLKRQAQEFTNRRLVEDFVGAGPHIVEGSPLKRVGEIIVPVLLVHGDADINVDIDHSQKMAAALRGAGKPAELMTFKGLDHQLDDSNARIQMLKKLGAFLDKAVGK